LDGRTESDLPVAEPAVLWGGADWTRTRASNEAELDGLRQADSVIRISGYARSDSGLRSEFFSLFLLLLGCRTFVTGLFDKGSCHKCQKPQAPTLQAPIRNRQTRKVANAKGLT